MLVGEQPGDREDLAGRPFVGPAGRLLDQALEDAGIERDDVYLTNAVKHFKWEAKGKRRLHKRPDASEVRACHRWLEAEMDLVNPRLIMALGATAAAALLGPKVRVTRDRGQLLEGAGGRLCTVTVHPSSILRASDGAGREQARQLFVADLRGVAEHLAAAS